MSRRTPPERRLHLISTLRNNFLAGLIVIAPIGMTVWLIWTLAGWIDSWVLPFVPGWFNPREYIGINLRGVGVIFFLLFTILIGWIAKGLIGRSFLRWGEGMVGRMPVIRSIYNAVKQIAETVFSQSGASFQTSCLVEFPCKGTWSVGFISTQTGGEIRDKTPGDEILTVFIPTTPNPTNGFLIFMAAKDVIVLDMSIEDAAKLIISGGLVSPPEPPVKMADATALAQS